MNKTLYHERTEYGRLIFKLFIDNDEPLDINDLMDKLSKGEKGKKVSRKTVLQVTSIMDDDGTLQPVPPKKTAKTYVLSKKFRTREFDQLMFFNDMEKEPLISDIGFFQHTLYGISLEDIPEMEQQLLFGVLHQVDNAMSGLYNINSAPEKLALQVLIAQFGYVLNHLFENEPSNKKCFQLLESLVPVVNQNGKKLKFYLCKGKGSPYPEKIFHFYFNVDYKNLKHRYSSIRTDINFKHEPKDIALLSTKIIDRKLTKVTHVSKKERYTINKERYCNRLDPYFHEIADKMVKELSKFTTKHSVEHNLYTKYKGDADKITEKLIHECIKPSNSIQWYVVIEKLILKNCDVPPNLIDTEGKISHINSELLSYIDAKDYFDNKREIDRDRLRKQLESFKFSNK